MGAQIMYWVPTARSPAEYVTGMVTRMGNGCRVGCRVG